MIIIYYNKRMYIDFTKLKCNNNPSLLFMFKRKYVNVILFFVSVSDEMSD